MPAFHGVIQVATDIKVRKQAVVLEHQAHTSLECGYGYASGEPDILTMVDDAMRGGIAQSCDAVQQRCLAASAGAEDARYALQRELQRTIQGETLGTFTLQIYGE
ncbi:hypothetical protein GCM10007053_18930 [Halioglobus pacificus]|uniref:Uncharacterized protein n=1 Tax=Parahalioglobus pacificus TaxID=930806 RepID=A0A919CKJ4_9GAMM|nr:hypothetical protein GCM10007053_18930 [Halioglobus pacificus]